MATAKVEAVAERVGVETETGADAGEEAAASAGAEATTDSPTAV